MGHLLEEVNQGSELSRFTADLLNTGFETLKGLNVRYDDQQTGVIVVEGFDCTIDEWTPWSECSLACGDVPGIQTKSRRCPIESEVRNCYVPACVSCDENNGGCHAEATCHADITLNEISCTCKPEHFGDGITCSERTS